MTHVLSFTDKQVALLLNALQFALVATDRCEQTAEDSTEYRKQLELGFACVLSATNDTVTETHAMLSYAAQQITDNQLYEIDASKRSIQQMGQNQNDMSGTHDAVPSVPNDAEIALFGLTPSEIARRKAASRKN